MIILISKKEYQVCKSMLFCCIIFLGFTLSGCALLFNDTKEPEDVKTGVYTVTETKEEGKSKEIKSEEIIVKAETSRPDKDTYKNKRFNKHKRSNRQKRTYDTYAENDSSPSIFSGDVTMSSDLLYGRARLWTDLSTNFNTDVISIPKWEHNLLIGGEGVELEIPRWNFGADEESYASIGFTIGSYKKRYENNLIRLQNYYIRENVYTWLTTLCFDMRYHPYKSLYFIFGIGSLHYRIRTSIVTNLPQYTYNGVEGKRLIFALKVGCGILWPKKSKFQLNTNAGFWLPLGDEAVLERAAGQVLCGVQYNF